MIKNQTDFDTFHPKGDRTYRIITETTHENGATERYSTSPLPLGELLKQNYPFIESALQIQGRNIYYPVLANGKKMDVSAAFSSSNFFDVFGFKLRQGNPKTALEEANSVIITPETARRFFGDRNPIGERLELADSQVYTITGVLENNLEKSHIEFDFLASLKSLDKQDSTALKKTPLQRWDDLQRGRVYVTLSENASEEQLAQILPHISNEISQNQKLASKVTKYSFEAQPLLSITPGEELRYEMDFGKTRTASELIFFSLVALLVLIMACFNYTNLSIARALKRSREVGVYRLLGAQRPQIMSQFIIQSTLIAVASLILAYALLPFIPLPTDISNEVHSVTPDIELISWFFLFSLMTGFIAGVFPAWVLSSLKPVEALKKASNLNLIKGLTIRKTIVTAQFAISIVLLISSLVIYKQSQFAATTDYGFRQENIINLNLHREVNPILLQDELSKIPGVEQISSISQPFGYFASPEDFYLKPESSPIHGDWFSVDRNLIPNLELELIAGRNFSKQMAVNPGKHAIINEQFLKVTPWNSPSEAIGNTFFWRENELQIVGVLKDFNYMTLTQPIRPMILHHQPEWSGYLNIRVADSRTQEFISQLQETWKLIAPQLPLEYEFYDESIYDYQSKEETVASIGYYAIIALAIACLGLLGMVTYTVEVRTQEVGIRKVMGAGIGNVITLLSSEFIWLLLIAAGIGLPIAYLIGQEFLNSYAYHIDIGVGTLVTGVAVIGVLGLLAIGSQTWKVAKQNPVDAIRTE